MPCSYCNISLVCSLCLRAFTTLRVGQIEFNNQFCILNNFMFIPFPEKKTLSFHFKCLLWGIFFNISKIESWTKMLRGIISNACHMSNFRILPSIAWFTQDTPPSPPKKQCWSVARTFLLPTKQHWPGRGHHGAKFAGWVSCE